MNDNDPQLRHDAKRRLRDWARADGHARLLDYIDLNGLSDDELEDLFREIDVAIRPAPETAVISLFGKIS